MKRIMAAAVLLATLMTIASRATLHVYAQSQGDGLLILSVTPEDATDRGTVPASYRIYGEPSILRFALSFSNEAKEAVVVERDVVQGAFQLRLSLGAKDIPVVVRWPAEIRMPGEWARPDSGIRLQVEPQRSSSWFVTLERADAAAFAPGSYSLQWEASRVPSALRTLHETVWQGRTASTRGTVFLEVAPATTPQDIASKNMMRAKNALLARDFDAAVKAYSAAVVADPTDLRAQSGLASVLLNRKRYKEAIAVYERLVPEPSKWQTEGGLLSDGLIMAYLGVGDEQKAREALRQSAVDPSVIEKKITEFKAINSRR